MRIALLSTRTRILGAFSLLLLVIGIISSVAIWRIHTGDEITRELVDDKLAKQLLTSDLLGVALVQITSEPAQSGIFTEWVHAAKTAAQISDGVCP